MPQTVQGAKHIFGITEVRDTYRIRLPLEAYYEYRLHEVKVVALISGTKERGGFSIHSIEKLKHSRLSVLLDTLQYARKTDEFYVLQSSVNHYNDRIISWLKIDETGHFMLSEELAILLQLKIGDKLVVIRGGNNGPAFIHRGEIYEAAISRSDIEIS